MLVLSFLLVGCFTTARSHDADIRVDRPRGVPLERKPLYDQTKDFICLDGSKKIPFEWVNDDYCDCKDGSDEPGTAACPNGSFHCLNLGYVSVTIPSSRVNDQICDCCDGSDEYYGWVHCPNTCEEMGRQMREEIKKREELQTNGYQIRQKMAIEGKKRKVEKQKLVEDLKNAKDELTPSLQELQTAKEEAERLETDAKGAEDKVWAEKKAAEEKEAKVKKLTDAFKELDRNNDGKVSVEEMQARKEFDQNADGEVSFEELKDIMGEHKEVDMQEFAASIWDKIEFQFVSKTSKVEYPTTTTAPPDSPPPTLPEEPTSRAPPNEIDVDQRDDHPQPDDEERDEDFDLPPEEVFTEEGDQRNKLREKRRQKRLEELRRQEAESEPGSDSSDSRPPYSEETQRLIKAADEARRRYSEAQSKIKKIEADLKDAEEFTNINFGPSDEFAPLFQKCFEITVSEYVYKLCLFDKATQRNKDTSLETSLGSWSKWIATGEDGIYKMLYEHGATCWNGPERSTTVDLICGLENALTASFEPSRCQYTFTFTTPAACDLPFHRNHAQDEL